MKAQGDLSTSSSDMSAIYNRGDKSNSNKSNGSSLNVERDIVKKNPLPENKYGTTGFEEWGGYMEAKKSKLNAQFNLTSANGGGIFQDVSIYINGYTDPPEDVLRRLFVKHGGAFHPYQSSRTTYVVATNLSTSSKNLYGSKTIKPEWITDSISSGERLDPRKYMLYDLNKENNQFTLTQIMNNLKSSKQNHIDLLPHSENARIHEDKLTVSLHEMDVDGAADPMISHQVSEFQNRNGEKNGTNKAVEDGPTNQKKVKMATEDGFLEDFFQNSRLHLISEQKKDMRNKIGKLRKNISVHKFEFLDQFEKETGRTDNSDNATYFAPAVILMHIDLDCFFVSVGLLTRPQLHGKPVVVTHSSGKTADSKSDIASASYEARKFGIKNGMWVAEAKRLCSSLEVIPYDFDEYKRISELFFDTLSKITLDIEVGSVDEMVIDATSILQKIPGATPLSLAEFIRKKIFEAVSCTASVGIGCNRLLAKLATKKAKPNGTFFLESKEAQTFINGLAVSELPGIGWSHEEKLREHFNVKLCSELSQIPLQELKDKFGNKTAEKMKQFCQGIDSSELNFGFERPKSISVDVNYGIRFSKEDQIHEFMLKLSKELQSRAIKAQATALNLTLKVLTRRKGAPSDPKKYGGHGIVDCVTRSGRFFHSTNDWQDIYRNVLKLLRLVGVPPCDYRGIGLTLTDISFDFDKTSSQKRTVQKTLFDMAPSRGRQMLEFAKKASAAKDHLTATTASTVGYENSCQSLLRTTENEARMVSKRVADNTVETIADEPTLKKRKVEQKSQKESVSSVKEVVNKNSASEIDVSVLKELPDDIAKEMAQHYGISLSQLESMNQNKTDQIVPSCQNEKNQSNNPYKEIDNVDPSFLSALPDAIREEVLMQLREANRSKLVHPTVLRSVITNQEPQPCSSKQALLRDAVLHSVSADLPQENDNTENRTKTNIENIVEPNTLLQLGFRLQCDEEVISEDESKKNNTIRNNGNEDNSDTSKICTPPSTPLIPHLRTKSSSGKRYRRRQSQTPSSTASNSSKRKLDFDFLSDVDFDEDDKIKPKQLKKFRKKLNIFWKKPSKNAPVIETESVALPALNGAFDIDEVRRMIREGVDTIKEPGSTEMETLRKYCLELVSRCWLQQASVVLSFICRILKRIPPESPWRDILDEILQESQINCTQLHNHELRLESLE